MKRCTECGKAYDETMNFCLDDGTALIGHVSGNEPATAVFAGPISTGSSNQNEATQILAAAKKQATENSIAVLPFVNMSTDAENEYFCDGLAEELLSALTKIDDLKVAARTAAFSFRGKNSSMDEIGRALNVNSILEGSVRKVGNRVRITIQLINAADGYHLWSERYDRDMRHIFEIQDEITLAVVDALKVKLLAPEKRALLKRHTNDAEAYQLYLRGRFFFYKRTPEGFRKAIEYFEKAIEIDGDYAIAVSGLGDSYVFLGFYEMVQPEDAAAKVKPLAERALELDDSLAETNTSYALLLTLYEWRHLESLQYFKKAIAADSKYALAYHLESAVSMIVGDHERAIAAESRAVELDPFTPVYNASLAWWYYIAGQNERSIEQCKRTIDIAPNHFFAHWVLGLAYAIVGGYSESIVSLQKALALNQFEPHVLGDLGRVFAIMGEREEARNILARLEQLATNEYVAPTNMAKIYLGLDENEKAIELLEKACDERAVRLGWSLVDPISKPLGTDPRFSAICARAGVVVKV